MTLPREGLGIDIAKDWIDVFALSTGRHRRLRRPSKAPSVRAQWTTLREDIALPPKLPVLPTTSTRFIALRAARHIDAVACVTLGPLRPEMDRRRRWLEHLGALRDAPTGAAKRDDPLSESGSVPVPHSRLADTFRSKPGGVPESGELKGTPKRTPAATLEPALQFFSSRWKVWTSGRPELCRLVLRLGFSERLAYCRESGPRTPKTSLPFNMLGGVQAAEVRGGGPSLSNLEPLLDVL